MLDSHNIVWFSLRSKYPALGRFYVFPRTHIRNAIRWWPEELLFPECLTEIRLALHIASI